MINKYVDIEYQKKKNIENDQKEEELMSKFLEDKVYPLFIKQGLFTSAKFFQFKGKEEQMDGQDVVCTLNNGEQLVVDNKTRWSMVNKKSAAIPVELRTFNPKGKDRHDGWLACLSEELYGEDIHSTDYILAIHPYTKNSRQKDACKTKCEDINKLDMFFIKIDDIFAHFKESYNLSFKEVYENGLKFDEEILSQVARGNYISYEMRKCTTGFESGIGEAINWKGEPYVTYNDVFHHSANTYMKEDPLNILIREDVCKQFPHTRHFIYTTKNGITEMYDTQERRPFSKRKTNR